MVKKIFVYSQTCRANIVEPIVEQYNIDIEVVQLAGPHEDANPNPVKKLPYITGDKNGPLSDTMAIIFYLFSFVPEEEQKKYLGRNFTEKAEILKWISLTNTEGVSHFVEYLFPIWGMAPYNKKKSDEAMANINSMSDVLEKRLSEFTYLVGERVTYADITAACVYQWGFSTALDVKWAARYPGINRWFKTVIQHPFLASRFSDFSIVEQGQVYQPPKKEKAPAKEQKPKAAKAEVQAEEPAPVEEKKFKHPLEALGKPKMVLDEWKRIYSNEETRETALPWFWEHYDPSEWSLYKVGFKYNDELTLTFMSNNLVGGFFNRLSASTKYLFGCLVVYGENNNNGIVGAFLVRGQDFAPAFDVAPDWESYEYSKLDPTDSEVKEFVNNMWAWDKPVTVNGESREIADGKVFK